MTRPLRGAALAVLVALAGTALTAQERLRLEFARPDEGAAILGASDAFTRATTPLDRRIRVRTQAVVTETALREFLSKQATAWSAHETRRLQPILDDVAARTALVAPALTGRIPVVRATAVVEDGAPHTRGDAIVVPERVLGWRDAEIRRVFAHELFHVLTRRNPALRDRLYATIGFRPCRTVERPAALADLKITNPDAPDERFAVEVRLLGVPLEVVPMLTSSATDLAQAVATPIAAQAELRFVAVRRDGDRCVVAVGPDGPVALLESDVEGLLDQVGRNTRYVIHPEEILADNFALLVLGARNVPSPEILERMRNVLGGGGVDPPPPR